MLIIQLVILLLVLSIIRSLGYTGNGIGQFVVSVFLSIIFVIQLGSVIVTGEIANYRYYENFNLADVFSVADFFGTEGVLIILGLILSTLIIHYLGSFLGNKIQRRTISFFSLLAGIVILSTSGGIINNAYSTLQLKLAGDASFSEALASLEIDESQYPEKDEIKASKGKNIIVLSLESLEKGYLEGNLSHLTPNLTRLAKENTFFTMEQSPAGGWTSASMYTVITGVPAYFGIHGNSIFQRSYENRLLTLTDVLKSGQYDLQYFMGKKEFSGIEDMLNTHGFTVKSEKDFNTQYEQVSWGIQDRDLFHEFKKELLQKKKEGGPFALFLSSISTHFPNGVKDKRMDSLFAPQKSRLELMAMATDYLVGDLIDFLEAEGMLSNTVFYIYPDHLLMGRKSRVLKDFGKRSLYLITNADPAELSYSTESVINQIDLPKIMLEGAGINHNVKFLTDFIGESDKNNFLRQNDKNILRLNEAALKSLNCKDGILLSLHGEQAVFNISNKEGLVVLSGKLPNLGNCQRILFDKNLRPFSDYEISASRVSSKPEAYAFLDVFMTGGMLYGSLKGKYNFGITKSGEREIVFDTADLSLIENISLEDDIQNYITLSSNSWNARKPSYFQIKGRKVNVSRGLTLISFNANSKDNYEFRTFDTHSNPEDVREFLSLLEKLAKDHGQYIILAHDSAVKSLQANLDELKNLGLAKLIAIKGRRAYTMHNLDGEIHELSDSLSVNIQLPFPREISNAATYFSLPKVPFEPSVDRYIAHAAGAIDGVTYTNSREALDFSYSRGFRLFELDIIETSDHRFVAAHDWKHWSKETKYEGSIPVSRDEFLTHKIRGKYTPLDMDAINRWFAAHPDAILVTDKVNTPEAFAQEFVDRDRLIMELFSHEAIQEASLNGISALISYGPLKAVKGDKIDYLKKNKVEYVAMSRRNISSELQLVKDLRENDIKVYVYNVNFDAGKNEQYVLDNEIGLVYGMYADKWLPAFLPAEMAEE